MTPTARTLHWLRSLGYQAGPDNLTQTRRGPCSVDLHGWVDMEIIGPPLPSEPRLDLPATNAKRVWYSHDYILHIQVTSGSNHDARADKSREPAQRTIKAGGLAYVISWSKRGPRGKRKVWTPRVEAL